MPGCCWLGLPSSPIHPRTGTGKGTQQSPSQTSLAFCRQPEQSKTHAKAGGAPELRLVPGPFHHSRISTGIVLRIRTASDANDTTRPGGQWNKAKLPTCHDFEVPKCPLEVKIHFTASQYVNGLQMSAKHGLRALLHQALQPSQHRSRGSRPPSQLHPLAACRASHPKEGSLQMAG